MYVSVRTAHVILIPRVPTTAVRSGIDLHRAIDKKQTCAQLHMDKTAKPKAGSYGRASH